MRLSVAVALATVALHAAPARAEWIPFDGATGLAGMVPKAPSVRVLESTRTRLAVEVDVPGALSIPVEAGGRELARWVVPGESIGRDPGRPALPYVARLVGLAGPDASVDVRVEATTTLRDVRLAPAPRTPKRCGQGAWEWSCDERAYATDVLLPASWASLDSAGSFAGQAVARLVVSPVRYDPATSEAVVARRLVVTVSLGDGVPARVTRPFDRVLRAGLLNGPVLRDGAPVAPERILVVGADALLPAVQPLVDWKVRQGLATGVVPLSEAGSTAAKVKEFIQAAWESEARPTYVLLVGDSGLVPFFEGDDGCASDWMYTQLDGDDLYSDVIVSRLSAKTVDGVATQVAKAVGYDKSPPEAAAAGWIPSATFVSSSQGDGASNDDVRSDIMADMFEAAGYAPVDRFYNSNGTDSASAISASLNAGRGYVAYLGHGSGTAWSTTSPPYSVDHVAALTNVGRLPAIMDVSCLNGQFDGYLDCLAEAWMKAGAADSPEGALAIYSSSTDTAWDQPAEMAIGVAEALLSKGLHRWGDATLYGRTYLIEKMGANPDTRLVLQQYVVFGDASVPVRTRAPEDLAVTVPATIPVGGFPVAVQVSGGAGPVAAALVALRKAGEVETAAYTGDDGSATLQVTTFTPGDLEVTVTAFDARPFEAIVKVAVTGCGVLLARPEAIACDGAVDVSLWDADLDTPAADCAAVAASASPGKSKQLAPCQAAGADEFHASFAASDLAVVHGSTITLSYDDADCEGAKATATATVSVDCQAPAISGVKVQEVTATSAMVTFQTDEPADGAVLYGTSAPPATEASSAAAGTAHVVKLETLKPSTTYVLSVRAVDRVGNVATDDNGGSFHEFTTPDCTPDCAGKACGPDGCGGKCGMCEQDQVCAAGACTGGKGCTVKTTPGWPGAKCESCVCTNDDYCCKWGSWDDLCVAMCEGVCGGCGGADCKPDCAGKACGDDGCGGSCGPCDPDATCIDGACVPDCEPDCGGRECGDDGCGGSCGSCLGCDGLPDASLCGAGACSHPCCPQCGGRECGDDGCGGSCGSCLGCDGLPDASLCGAAACSPPCCPQCGGRECGDDGCGGSCGEPCPEGLACNADGRCACVPSCLGRECGDDGCGGACGACANGETCAASGLCQPASTGDATAPDASPSDPVGTGDGTGASCTASPRPLDATFLLPLAILALTCLRPRVRRTP
jgi:hypothetical protein